MVLSLLLPTLAFFAVSSVVYPPIPKRGGFEHREHQATPSCVECHPRAVDSARAVDDLLPDRAVCAKCHRGGSSDSGSPTTPPAILFGHRAHMSREGMTCVGCHQAMDAPGDHRPPMELCRECHDGERASKRCSTCHPSGPDGLLVTDLPTGRLVPRGRSGDNDHRGEFRRRHSSAAKVAPATCDACHDRTRDCFECHFDAGRARPPVEHPGDYVQAHASDARRNQPDCQACHRLQSFCLDCHVRSRVSDAPKSFRFGADARLLGTYHPQDFIGVPGSPAGPMHHKFDARRALRACVSCHQEATCVRCHATSATDSLRQSPHPPGFTKECGRLRGRNERTCLKCHQSAAELDAMCR